MLNALPGGEIRRLTLRLGRQLEPGARSASGLYALVSQRSGAILRISLFQDAAEFMCDYTSRGVYECRLQAAS